MSYHTSVERIGPERARELLSHNYDNNRNVRRAYVSQLAEVMRQGRYMSENGQTIVVGDDDGVLYDGQHRLMAIDESGVTLKMIVAYITEGKEKFKTIDANTPRSASDFVSLPNRNECAALAKVMAAIEWGKAPFASSLQGKYFGNTAVDRGLVTLYCEQKPNEVLEAVRKGKRMREAVGCGTVRAYATFMSLVWYLDDENLIDEFFEDFTSLAPTSKTVQAVKTIIVRNHMKAARPEFKWMVGTLLDAYYHFVEADDSTMLNKQSARLEAYGRKLIGKRQRNGASLVA